MWETLTNKFIQFKEALLFQLIILGDFIKYSFIGYDKSYTTESTNKFKFMTLNLRREILSDKNNRWHYRKDTIIEYIKSERPHIVCSQEVMPHMFKFINHKLGNIYGHYSVDNFFGCRLNKTLAIKSEGNTIIYDKTKYTLVDKGQFWLSDNPKRPSASWGNTCLRTCVYVGLKDANGQVIYVFNTHLDHTSAEARKKSAELIAERIKQIASNNSVYLCGDFNAIISSDELLPLNLILDNTFNHNKNNTFNCFHKSRSKALDAIYYLFGENYNIIVPNVKISDHSPVIITSK